MAASKTAVKLAGTRLENSIGLLNDLDMQTSPEEIRPVLEEVLANGGKNLGQLEETQEPDLLRRTHMTMAQAQLRLASLESAGGDRQDHIAATADHCELASALTPEGASLDKKLEMTAWAITLLAGAVSLSSGVQQQALRRRLKTCLGQFEENLSRQVNQRLDAADTIFAGQMLLEGARNMEQGEDRRVALQSALTLAGQASDLGRQSGDTKLAAQAQALFDEIQAAV